MRISRPWWCGQKFRPRGGAVASRRFRIEGAYGSGFRVRTARAVLAADLRRQASASGSDRDRQRGVDYVGQELVRLSTTPVWEMAIAPRPFVLRVLQRTAEAGPWCPADSADRRAARFTAPSDGGRRAAADVWVVSGRRCRPQLLRGGYVGSGASPAGCRAGRRTIVLARAYSEAPRRRWRLGGALGVPARSRLSALGPASQVERIQRLLVTGAPPLAGRAGAAAKIAAEALRARKIRLGAVAAGARRSAPRLAAGGACRRNAGRSSRDGGASRTGV